MGYVCFLLVLFYILVHQWFEIFYLASANIGNSKMSFAEFHKFSSLH